MMKHRAILLPLMMSAALSGCGKGPGPDPIVGLWRSSGGYHVLSIEEDLQGVASLGIYSGGDVIFVNFSMDGRLDGDSYRFIYTTKDPGFTSGPFEEIAEVVDEDTIRSRATDSAEEEWNVFARIKEEAEESGADGNEDPPEAEGCHGYGPTSCSGTGRTSCEDVIGCSWTPDYRHGNYVDGDCDGTPDSCSSLSTESECRRQSGCDWN